MAIGIASVLGAGYSPVAPGTCGALVALLVYGLLFYFFGAQTQLFLGAMIGIGVLSCILGVWAGNVVEAYWGHDASKVVIDEFAGQWITLLFIPFSYLNILLALILFRFFDIYKPLFIRKMEQLPGGWGVMMDDVLSGIYANIVLQLIVLFIFN